MASLDVTLGRACARRTARWLAAVCIAAPLAGLSGQQPATPASPVFRAPVLTLVLPAAGASVPADKPVVVFHFTQSEPLDPIDVRSFAVAVDGVDRTALFQLTGDEAWGTLGGADHPLAAGAHQVAARICSIRGACGTVDATISVVLAAVPSETKETDNHRSTRQRVLDALVGALRKLLIP